LPGPTCVRRLATGVRARREAGHADTCSMLERAPWQAPADPIEGIVEHH
jgi:NTE family protein